MDNDPDSEGKDNQVTDVDEGNVNTPSEALRSDEVACMLAYENGWRLCDDNLRVLEAQRTRAVGLLSMTLLAGGIAVSAFTSDSLDGLQWCGVVGSVLFGVGVVGVAVCAGCVAWPIKTDMALRPKKILRNYVNLQHPGKTPTWVYKNLATDLDKAYKRTKKTLGRRNTTYKGLIVAVAVLLVGAVIVVLDVAF